MRRGGDIHEENEMREKEQRGKWDKNRMLREKSAENNSLENRPMKWMSGENSSRRSRGKWTGLSKVIFGGE